MEWYPTAQATIWAILAVCIGIYGYIKWRKAMALCDDLLSTAKRLETENEKLRSILSETEIH